jgi:hypothetical protein
MSAAPTDPGDEPLSEEGFYQVKAKQPPQQNPNLAPQSGGGTGEQYKTYRLGSGQTYVPPEKPPGDTVLPDTGRFAHFTGPDDYQGMPYPYRPDYKNTIPNPPGSDTLNMPRYHEYPDPIVPQPSFDQKFRYNYDMGASDNGDVSNQPLTEDGFKQLLAKSTNVPRTGGPDPKYLQASIGQSAPGSSSAQFTPVDPTTLATREEYDSEGKSSQYGPHEDAHGNRNRLVTGPYVGLHPDDMSKFGLKWGDYVQEKNGEVYRVQESASKDHTIEFHADRPGQFQDANPNFTIVAVRHATADDPPMPNGESVSNTGQLGSGTGQTSSSPHIPTLAEQTAAAQKRDAEAEQARKQQKPSTPTYKQKEDEPILENEPVTEQEDEVGYPAWSQRGGFMSPQQQAVQESSQRRSTSKAGEVSSENPVLAKILAQIYEQYGGAEA